MAGLRKMSSICEQCASEYDILFNGSKSKLLFFKAVVVMYPLLVLLYAIS